MSEKKESKKQGIGVKAVPKGEKVSVTGARKIGVVAKKIKAQVVKPEAKQESSVSTVKRVGIVLKRLRQQWQGKGQGGRTR